MKAILEVAIANNDPFPDNICPRCGQDITGWEDHRYHYPPDVIISKSDRHRGLPMPFVNTPQGPDGPPPCGWDRDYLMARLFRRTYIREHSQ